MHLNLLTKKEKRKGLGDKDMDNRMKRLMSERNEGLHDLAKMMSEDLKFDEDGNLALIGTNLKIIVFRKEDIILENEK